MSRVTCHVSHVIFIFINQRPTPANSYNIDPNQTLEEKKNKNPTLKRDQIGSSVLKLDGLGPVDNWPSTD